MRPSPRLERALGPTLILLPPLLACLLVSWGLLWLVSLREQAIAPVNGGGLAPFVQIAWSWNQGLGRRPGGGINTGAPSSSPSPG
jgi:hypothetical protein